MPIVTEHSEDLQCAIRRARAFLISRILDDQYHLGARSNTSDACPVDGLGQVFSAYFIARALVPAGIPKDARKVMSQRLVDEEQNGLWGFGKNAVVDSDDTAFVLRTRLLLDEPIRWLPLLGFHSPSAGWFRTFRSTRDCRLVMAASETNNRMAHPEVNANIFALLRTQGGAQFINLDGLVRTQHPEGYWPSYFYPDRYYGTWMVLQNIVAEPRFQQQAERAIAFLHASQNTDGSWGDIPDTYQTALALNGLIEAHQGHDSRYRDGVNYLLSRQSDDGAWHSDSIIYQHVASDSESELWTANDVNHVVTTALGLSALQAMP